MQIAKFRNEKDLAHLVKRLYVIKGRGAMALSKEAEAALLRANPQLEDLKKVPNGAIIIVPQVDKAALTDESRPGGMFSDETLTAWHRILSSAQKAVSASRRLAVSRDEETLQLLKLPAWKPVVKNDSSVKNALEKVGEATTARMKESNSLRASDDRRFAELEKELERLASLIS